MVDKSAQVTASLAHALARYDAAEAAYDDARADPHWRSLHRADPCHPRPPVPSIVPDVGYPLTVYRPSRCHDSWVVVYKSHGWHVKSEWIVPGTYEERLK